MASSVVNGERAEIRAASNCSSHVNRVLTTSLVVQLRVRVQRTVARETASDSRDLPVPRPLTLPRAKGRRPLRQRSGRRWPSPNQPV